MSVIEGTGGGVYDPWATVVRTSKPNANQGPGTGDYSNQDQQARINLAVTKIGPATGRYDPELAAFLAGELS
jgi:hypothetical protein